MQLKFENHFSRGGATSPKSSLHLIPSTEICVFMARLSLLRPLVLLDQSPGNPFSSLGQTGGGGQVYEQLLTNYHGNDILGSTVA